MSIILFILILLILVVVHELGHFFVARYFGVRVDEFGFGYPPRATKLFNWKETVFTLNWLPFGGFVKIFGENPDDENTNGPDRERSFVHKAKYKQALILVAGVFMNFLLAWLLIIALFTAGSRSSVDEAMSGARYENIRVTLVDIAKNSPAAKAGLVAGDEISSIALDSDPSVSLSGDTATVKDVQDFINAHSGTPLRFTVGERLTCCKAPVVVTPVAGIADGKAGVGVSIDRIGTLHLPLGRAIVEATRKEWYVSKTIFVFLGKLIHDTVLGHPDISAVTGPVGLVHSVGITAGFGFSYLIWFIAFISINLGIINLLPVPALDGGRLFFLLIESVKGSRINPKIANIVNTVGFGLLILLMLVVTYHDIVHLIKG